MPSNRLFVCLNQLGNDDFEIFVCSPSMHWFDLLGGEDTILFDSKFKMQGSSNWLG